MITAADRGVPDLPVVIQGGMGVGVSGWRLAAAVSRAGGLGVVSGVALDTLLARRLQDGDADETMRAALSEFPAPDVAASVLKRWFVPGGRPAGRPYRAVPRLRLDSGLDRQRLAVVAAFAEIHLARAAAPGAPVGVNFMEKLQMATPAAAYGAMLAGADVVLVGAGIPARIPVLLDTLAGHDAVEFPVDVAGDSPGRHHIRFDPRAVMGGLLPPLERPAFLAIVSSHTLATFLARDPATRPDGFVIEGSVAGGHNAPPRGAPKLDHHGEPVYGERDQPDLGQIAGLGLPFWLAGGYSRPDLVAAAQAAGARGVQVGTLFALSAESGLAEPIRRRLLDGLAGGSLRVRTDPKASPTGFPFKVAQLDGTLSDGAVYDRRTRTCDLGYLRTPYVDPSGRVAYRCPAEPVSAYIRKGGTAAQTDGRVCLCNGLTSAIGLGQGRAGRPEEPPIVTLGSDVGGALEMLQAHAGGWSAAQVVDYLRTPTGSTAV